MYISPPQSDGMEYYEAIYLYEKWVNEENAKNENRKHAGSTDLSALM
jgi:hypothetical protein